jgi:hypothetical protein
VTSVHRHRLQRPATAGYGLGSSSSQSRLREPLHVDSADRLIACVLKPHRGTVTGFLPLHAMSGGTLISLGGG